MRFQGGIPNGWVTLPKHLQGKYLTRYFDLTEPHFRVSPIGQRLLLEFLVLLHEKLTLVSLEREQ